MKALERGRIGALLAVILLAFVLFGGQTAYAAEEEYTYTVRLYAGNLGELTEGGIEIRSESASIKLGKEEAVISGLKYGDTVYIRPQEAAASTDERYYVRGVRRSGRDNSEAEAPTFHVACDRDYVVAYGVSGDMVAYTVNYQDLDGNEIMQSDTYYGNIGERQYVSSRYIDGYQPQALNMVKTLSQNAAENVFTFQYEAIDAGRMEGELPGDETVTGGTGTATAPEDDDDDDGTAPDDEGEEILDGEIPLGGDADAEIPDNQVPLGGQKNTEDLDDEQVPLANSPEKSSKMMGYMPIYAGIGVAALSILAVAALYLAKRCRKVAVDPVGKTSVKAVGKNDKFSGSGK